MTESLLHRLNEALREQVSNCFAPDCPMCNRHDALCKEADAALAKSEEGQ